MEKRCYYCKGKLNADNEKSLDINMLNLASDTFSVVQKSLSDYHICKDCYFNHFEAKQTNSLKKSEILSLKKRISSTFENKESVTAYPLKVFYQVHDLGSEYPAQALFTVPKRNFKLAVDRNLLRRRMKEAYRKNKHFFYNYLNQKNINISLVMIYIHKQKVDYSEIEQQLILSLKKIIRKIDSQ